IKSSNGRIGAHLTTDAGVQRAASTTFVFVAINGKLVGTVVLADLLKDSASEAVRQLRAEGLRIVMLTGDRRESAMKVARELGIEEVEAEVQPQQKAEVVKCLREQGRIVAM